MPRGPKVELGLDRKGNPVVQEEFPPATRAYLVSMLPKVPNAAGTKMVPDRTKIYGEPPLKSEAHPRLDMVMNHKNRALMDTELIYHVMRMNNDPDYTLHWMLTGATGSAKSMLPSDLACQDGQHLASIEPNRRENPEKWIRERELEMDPTLQRLNLVDKARIILESVVFHGISFFDEVPVVTKEDMSFLNNILIGRQQDLGDYSIPWSWANIGGAGNFEYKDSAWEPSTVYRFLWMSVEVAGPAVLEQAEEVKEQWMEGTIDYPDINPLFMPKRLPKYFASSATSKLLNDFLHKTYGALREYQEKSRGILPTKAKNPLGIVKEVLGGDTPLDSLLDMKNQTGTANNGKKPRVFNRQLYQPSILGFGGMPLRYDLLEVIGESKQSLQHTLQHAEMWRKAPDIPPRLQQSARVLYHPAMEFGDYFEILRFIYTNPPIGQEGRAILFDEDPKEPNEKRAYKQGMELVLATMLNKYFNNIRTSAMEDVATDASGNPNERAKFMCAKPAEGQFTAGSHLARSDFVTRRVYYEDPVVVVKHHAIFKQYLEERKGGFVTDNLVAQLARIQRQAV